MDEGKRDIIKYFKLCYYHSCRIYNVIVDESQYSKHIKLFNEKINNKNTKFYHNQVYNGELDIINFYCLHKLNYIEYRLAVGRNYIN